MSLISRWIPTALGSERRVQPAFFAARLTAGAIEGGGPSPKPTLEPRMSLLGSIDLIESVFEDDVVAAGVDDCVDGTCAVVPLEELELGLPLLEPQPASTRSPASSASARRDRTPRTLEARGWRPRGFPYSSSFRNRSTSPRPAVLSASW